MAGTLHRAQLRRAAAIAVAAAFAAASAIAQEPERAPEIDARVLAIQPFQRTSAATLGDGTRLWLIDANTHVHDWLLLVRAAPGRSAPAVAHLENPFGTGQRVTIDAQGLAIERGETRTRCPLTTDEGRDLFERGRQAFAALCGGRLLLRAQLSGYRTTEELAVSILRSMGTLGESLINIYKETFGVDADLERAAVTRGGPAAGPATGPARPAVAEPGPPKPARIAPEDANASFVSHRLGITLAPGADGRRPTMRPGQWYASALQDGAFVSLIAPHQIADDILRADLDRAHPLDPTESQALVYLVAFDLEMYSLGFHVGTDHPDVDWSPRPSVPRSNPRGPDGFDTVRPFARVGMVAPQDRARLAGIFVGGFKREHGAFRYGPLSQTNQGSHYGFVEHGVVLSRLQPGLSTLFGRLDGTTELRTWRQEDAAEMPNLLWARQNGVPLVEPDPATGRPVPGREVRSWGLGNWSGALVIRTDPEGHQIRSAELRSVRAGACLMTNEGHRFLVYGYFSAATPSAMARVFQAYGCSYALLLDMNSPELTYATVVGRTGEALRVEALNAAMAESDPGRGAYRFLAANDNRDFFTVLRRPPRR